MPQEPTLANILAEPSTADINDIRLHGYRRGQLPDWMLGPNQLGLPPRHPGYIENTHRPSGAFEPDERVAREMGDAAREGNWPLAGGALAAMLMGAAPGGKRRSLVDRIAEVPQVPRREVLPSDFAIMRKPSIGGTEEWVAHDPNRTQKPSLAYGADPHVWARLDPERNQVRIGSSLMPLAERGTGQGVAMYQRLIDEAHRHGYEVKSDAEVSSAAQQIYKALAGRGYEVKEHPRVERSRHGTAFADGPVYTVWPRAERLFSAAAPALMGPALVNALSGDEKPSL